MKYRIWNKSKRKMTFDNDKTINWKKINKGIYTDNKKLFRMSYIGKDNTKQDAYVFDMIQTGEDIYVIMNAKDPYVKGLKYSKVVGNLFQGIKL